MHERSLIRSLLRQVEALAAENGRCRVVEIRVRIGEFSGVETELLRFAYDELVQDTSLRGAELIVEQVALEAVCHQCNNKFRIDRFRFACPKCGGAKLTICGGEELLLESFSLQE